MPEGLKKKKLLNNAKEEIITTFKEIRKLLEESLKK